MFEESYGKPVKRLVDSIPKAHTRQRDGMVELGVRNCSCKRAAGAYTLGYREPKKEIPVDPGSADARLKVSRS